MQQYLLTITAPINNTFDDDDDVNGTELFSNVLKPTLSFFGNTLFCFSTLDILQ